LDREKNGNKTYEDALMKQKLIQSSIAFLLSLMILAGIYFIPWQAWLDNYVWVKAGIGFAIFILPGAGLYKILDRQNTTLGGNIVIGFSLSILLITILGWVARFANLSFAFIEVSFVGIGALGLGVNLSRNKFWRKTGRANILHLLDYWPILLITVMIALAVTNRIISEDDQIYIAYQLHFQRAIHLDFKEIIFGYDQLSPTRFWLVGIPLVLSFLSSITRVPGIVLATGYYEPFLAVLSAISLYRFARSLGLSVKMTSLGVVFQFTFLVLLSEYLHPGSSFLHQLSTDKAIAAFIIAPVFFERVRQLLKRIDWNNIVTTLLVTLCLSVTHPVIFAYAAFVAGLTALFGSTGKTLKQRILPSGLIIALGTLPQIAIRLVNHPSNNIYGLSTTMQSDGIESMIQIWGNSKFYGFNPSILAIKLPYENNFGFPSLDNFIQYGWLAIPILAAIFSLKKLRSRPIASYMLASFTLPMLAYIPFTGWLIGYIFTPWMLERTLWIYPFGISSIFFLNSIKEFRSQKYHCLDEQVIKKYGYLTISLISAICIGIVFLYMKEESIPDFQRFEKRAQRYEELAQIGLELDNANTTNFRIVGTDEINDFIPTFSAKGKLISYRPSDPTYSYFILASDHRQRVLDRQTIFSDTATPEEKLQLCQKYQIKYLLVRKDEISRVGDLISFYPSIFTREIQTRNYVVVAIHY